MTFEMAVNAAHDALEQVATDYFNKPEMPAIAVSLISVNETDAGQSVIFHPKMKAADVAKRLDAAARWLRAQT